MRVVGHCDDMPAALMLADLVVNPSLEPEPFGRTVIEAQAMGRPVIVADHGGTAETVDHGVTGWRVPSPAMPPPWLLASAIEALRLSPRRARGTGRPGPRQRLRPLHHCRNAAGHAGRVSRAAGLTRILVIKLGALGDVVLAFGPFAAIRARHPDAAITLLTTAPFAGFLAAAPWFDAVAVDTRPRPWNGPGLLRAAPGAARLRLHLRLADVAAVRLVLPAWPGGRRGPASRRAARTRTPTRRGTAMHTVERQREQLAMAGVTAFPEPETDWLRAHAPALPQRYAVLIPGAAPHRPAKRWPAERFAQLATQLEPSALRERAG